MGWSSWSGVHGEEFGMERVDVWLKGDGASAGGRGLRGGRERERTFVDNQETEEERK
jgi:hypothetical protein